MSLLDSFAVLWDDVDTRLAKVAEEAFTLRQAVVPLEPADGLPELHAKMIDARKAQDRLETLVAQVGRIRARARIARTDALNAVEDRQTESIMTTERREYITGMEVRAQHHAAAIEEKMALRRVERNLAQIEEVFDYINLLYRGLDGARRDLESQLRLLSVLSRLES